MKKYKEYEYKEIEQYAKDNDFEIIDIGTDVLGENFVILKNKDSKVLSFVYSGYKGTGGMFKCIYSDFKEIKDKSKKTTCHIQSFYTHEVLSLDCMVRYNYMLQYIINGVITNVCMEEVNLRGHTHYEEHVYQRACDYYGKNLGDDYYLETHHYNIK